MRCYACAHTELEKMQYSAWAESASYTKTKNYYLQTGNRESLEIQSLKRFQLKIGSISK